MALAGGRLTTLDRRIIALALPALGALIVEPLYTLTDTAIVGHLGRAQLGGPPLATTVLNLVGWTAAFLEMATVSQVAFRRGRGDAHGADTAATAAYLTAGALGVVVALVVASPAPPTPNLRGATGPIQDYATPSLRIPAVGMPFLLVTFA